jgi:hypothetical protein
MPAPKDFPFSFRNVFILSREQVFIAGGDDEADSKELSVSFVFRWDGSWISRSFRGDAIDLCAVKDPELTIMLLDLHGFVHRWTMEEIIPQHIDSSDEGPDTFGPMREIRLIKGTPYVVGMGRTVYRRLESGIWERIDQGIRVPDMDWDEDEDEQYDYELEGLNSIDGFADNNIYAVGWNGAIWRFDGRNWLHLQSPTNVSLNSVLCAPNGKVYIAGQLGTVLEGREDQWRIITSDESKQDYWDITWFNEQLYLVTPLELHVLKGDVVTPVDIRMLEPTSFDAPLTFSALDARDGVIWAIGPKTAAFSIDGINWTETSYE